MMQSQIELQQTGQGTDKLKQQSSQEGQSQQQNQLLLQTESSGGLSTISAAELSAQQEIDNMSIAEIIQQRFKNKMKVTEVKTPQEVANVIIKSPEEANLVEDYEGTQAEQKQAEDKIKDIETNRMYAWSDMSKVKRELWNKLHAVKDLMKKKATNLAQIAQQMANQYVPQPVRESFG